MNGFSKYYYEVIKKYKVFHENGIKNQPGFSTFLGYYLTKWILKIQEIIKTNNCNSLLDFGCGKAFLYKNKFKIGDKEFTNLSDFWNLKNICSMKILIEKNSRKNFQTLEPFLRLLSMGN